MLRRRSEGAKEAVRGWEGREGREREREAEGRFIALLALGMGLVWWLALERVWVTWLVVLDVWRACRGAVYLWMLRRERRSDRRRVNASVRRLVRACA